MKRHITLFGFVLIGSLVLLLIAISPLLLGTTPIYGDLEAYHLPAKRFYYDCLASGNAFDWMPYLMGGFYLSGEGEMGTYHPLHLIMYRWLTFENAFTLDFVAPFPLLFLGAFLFFRRKIDQTSALLGSTLLTFSFSFMTNIGYPHLNIVMAHTPWILLAMDALFVIDPRINGSSTRDPLSSSPKLRFVKRLYIAFFSFCSSRSVLCAAIGFLTGSQILFGHPHALWLSLMIEAGYLLSLFHRSKSSLFAIRFFLLGKILGFSLGAIQLLATYSAYRSSTRMDYTDVDILLFSLPPRAFLGAVAPYLYWNRVRDFGGIYFGAVPLVLFIWWISGFIRRIICRYRSTDDRVEPARNDRLGLMALVLTFISAWLATGLYGGLYDLHLLIPIIGKLRAPVRYLILSQFSICLLSAIAFSELVEKVNTRRRTPQYRTVLPWVIAVLSILLAMFFTHTGSAAPAFDKEAYFYPAPVLFVIAAIGLSLASSGLRIGVFILVIIAFIDIGYYSLGLPVVRHTIFEAQEYSKWTNKVKEPPIRGNGRVLYRDFNENLLSLRNYRLINGYTGGITPKKLLDYDDVSVLRIADVEWVFRRKNSVVGSSPRDSQPIGWKRVSNRLPRVRLVTNTHMSKFPARDIKKIDIKNNVLVTRPIDLEKDELGKAVIVRDKPGDIGIEVDTPGRQMLVLSESYNSEWRVFVDEKREKLYRINGDFMGCVIEKGEHKVRFVFVPMALTYGLPISILAISIALILCFMPLIARFISKRFCAQTD